MLLLCMYVRRLCACVFAAICSCYKHNVGLLSARSPHATHPPTVREGEGKSGEEPRWVGGKMGWSRRGLKVNDDATLKSFKRPQIPYLHTDLFISKHNSKSL